MESVKSTQEQWLSFINEANRLAIEDESFITLSSRDQILSFYYYYLDVISDHRSYFQSQRLGKVNLVNLHFELSEYRNEFDRIFKSIVESAIEEKLLKGLPAIHFVYRKFFWLQHLFILRYWVTDDSIEDDNTIALIEKAQCSTFDFLGKCELKSSLDFWKFVIQNPFKLNRNYE